MEESMTQVEESMTEETGGSRDFPGLMKDSLVLRDVDARIYSPLALAYIGDAVYELLIRTRVINHGSVQVSRMHKKSASLVKASAQAELVKLLMDELTEEEKAVFKRGRNAKSVTMARNATMTDYRMATGFEALVGYLYLTERYERLLTLVHDGLDRLGEFDRMGEST